MSSHGPSPLRLRLRNFWLLLLAGALPATALILLHQHLAAGADGCRPDRAARHDTTQLPGGGLIKVMASSDEGADLPSGVVVTIIGHRAAANTTVRVAADSDVQEVGRTGSVQLDGHGDGATVLDPMPAGPATVVLIEPRRASTELHLTIPACNGGR